MSFGWITLQPAWRTMQAWHQNHTAFRANFESDSAYLINKMTTAATNQIGGTADLALKVAKKRIQAEITKKIDKLA